jgi:iron complex transport system ATP-binding protein
MAAARSAAQQRLELTMLTVSHLSIQYENRPVVHDLSFQLQPGKIMAVIGPNGAGKSTLVRCLSGILPAASGEIRYDGRDVLALNEQQRARLMAVVPQARSLPAGFSALQVVQLGRTPYLNWYGRLSKQDESVIRRAMERTCTLELADRMVDELSGGEQQRLLLARALVQATPILLLDEPTTYLDLQYQIHLLEMVRELVERPWNSDSETPAQPPAVLVVLHDLNLVSRFADQVLLLVDGRCAAQGDKSSVLRPEVLSAGYGIDLAVHHLESGGPAVILPAC